MFAFHFFKQAKTELILLLNCEIIRSKTAKFNSLKQSFCLADELKQTTSLCFNFHEYKELKTPVVLNDKRQDVRLKVQMSYVSFDWIWLYFSTKFWCVLYLRSLELTTNVKIVNTQILYAINCKIVIYRALWKVVCISSFNFSEKKASGYWVCFLRLATGC